MATKRIACFNDPSSHGGHISVAGQSQVMCNGSPVAIADLGKHVCPIAGHGTTPLTAVTVKSFAAGKLIITTGATAGCGAVINPPDRHVYVE